MALLSVCAAKAEDLRRSGFMISLALCTVCSIPCALLEAPSPLFSRRVLEKLMHYSSTSLVNMDLHDRQQIIYQAALVKSRFSSFHFWEEALLYHVSIRDRLTV